MHRSLIVCDVEYVVKSVKLMPSPIVYLFLVLVCSQSHWEKCIKCTSIYLFDIFKLHADERYPYPYHNDFYQTSHFSVPFMSSILFYFVHSSHTCMQFASDFGRQIFISKRVFAINIISIILLTSLARILEWCHHRQCNASNCVRHSHYLSRTWWYFFWHSCAKCKSLLSSFFSQLSGLYSSSLLIEFLLHEN